MRGMWKHLERLGGGVGTRGPGESQLETDRRLAQPARSRCSRGGCASWAASARRDARSGSRTETPTVALAGYTNVGKSTLLNALTGADVSVENRLFETLDPTTRAFEHDGQALPRDRHRRVHPPAAAPARRGLRGDARGDARRRPRPARRRCVAPEDVLAGRSRAVETVLARDRRERRARRARAQQGRRARSAGAAARCEPVSRGAAGLGGRPGRASRSCARGSPSGSPTGSTTVRLLVPYDGGRVLADLYALGAPIDERMDTDGRRARPCAAAAARAAAVRAATSSPGRRGDAHASAVTGCPSGGSAPTRVCPGRAYEGDAGLDLAACERVDARARRARRRRDRDRGRDPARATRASCVPRSGLAARARDHDRERTRARSTPATAAR